MSGPFVNFIWGKTTLAALIAVLALWTPAEAQGGKANQKLAKVQHAKLDQEMNRVAGGVGNSDVIVVFNNDFDSLASIKAAGGIGGRRLGIIKARAGRMPNALLERLANDPKVKRVHRDRPTEAFLARTAAAIGARNVQTQYGYTGAGIGVAVIDSGITPWHDDLTVANRLGQRVTAFVDFVNGQTAKYDDWGHGTHVSGIIAGNGYDSTGARESIAPNANIISLKAFDGEGKGRISYIIAALDWAVTNKAQYNIRVVNMSLGAGVFESYHTDPLTQAAKRAVDAGIVVVAAAGNMGKAANGQPQYGTIDRRDDTMALYNSRGPTMIDFGAKPDLVAPGSGTVSLSNPNSLFYNTKAAYLVAGKRIGLTYLPYLTLSGTSMAAPVVSGTVALMIQANPSLTPNMVKAILQFTAQVYTGYNYLTQGAGFLNTLGAVRLSRYFALGHKGDSYPNMKAWSKHIFWGNGDADNIVWGNSGSDLDNISWGSSAGDGDEFGDDTVEVSRFISPPPTTVEGFERFILWAQRERQAGNYACFAVVPAAA